MTAAGTTPDRLNAEGLKRLAAGDSISARRAYRQALALGPGFIPALGNLANLDARGEAMATACRGYRRALAIQPTQAGLHLMLGTALLKAGEDAAGERALAQALRLSPGHPTAHLNLATYKLQRGRAAEAEPHFRQALEGAPTLEPALAGLARVLTQSARQREAQSLARRAVTLAPSSADSLAVLGQVSLATGLVSTATRIFRRALVPAGDLAAMKSLMLALHYDPEVDSETLFRLYRHWAGRQPPPDPQGHANRPDPERRLKVGYLSADLHGGHPVERNVVGLIEHHDPALVDVHVYAADGASDPVAERIRAKARIWRSITGLDGRSVAALIRNDGIDVLMVLAGHTPLNRIGVAALKPAPVQVGMHDYTTSGLAQMDGFLSDPVLNPPDGEERFIETVVRLPCFYLHMPIEDVPLRPVSTAPLVLGSCSNPVKLNDRVIELWARVLAALPASRLVLKFRDAFSDPDLVRETGRRFARHGIAASRVTFDGKRTDRLRHLETVGGFDIALDPFPFNGCTTTYEALWMGVPVVTLSGRRFIGRMSTAMLHQVGLGDLAVETEAAYVGTVVALAKDAARRARLRQELRGRLKASPLLDAPAHARAVEAALREMWRAWCRSHRAS